MTLIDTHTHLYLDNYNPDGGGEAAVRRALQAGVGHMIFPNIDAASIEPMEALAAKFPGAVSCAMGLHPTEVREGWQQVLDDMERRLSGPTRYVAIGEAGIDMYWDTTFRAEQIEAFARQARMARDRNLPLIIHSRDGLADTLSVLRQVPGVRAVFHSFGGSAADVEAIRSVGDFYFGINGIVTFKNSGVKDVLPHIGLDRLLLETDSPYLAPVPRRGKRNESAYLSHIAAFVADALAIPADQVAAATSANARSLFAI